MAICSSGSARHFKPVSWEKWHRCKSHESYELSIDQSGTCCMEHACRVGFLPLVNVTDLPQDPTRRRTLQLGSHLVPSLVQEISQLPCRMVDSDHLASPSRRHCLRFRNPNPRPIDPELSTLRLPEMARNNAVLLCIGIRSVHQHLSWPPSPTD